MPSCDCDTAIRRLVAQRSKLLAYIWSLVRDIHLAEDIYQDVLVRVIHHHSEIADLDALLPWARRVARNRAIDLIRRESRQTQALDEDVLTLLDQQWRQTDTADAAEITEAVRHCMDQLTPHARRLIDMRFARQMSTASIAETIGRKSASVYTAFSRIYRTLALCLRSQIGEQESGYVQ